MKVINTLLILLIPFVGFGQYLCSHIVVNNVFVDSTNMYVDFEIYDGNSIGQPYPYIAFSIDNIGDTIQFGNLDSFGNIGLDTSNYSYTLNKLPIYPLTIFYIYGMNSDTCILYYDKMQKTYIPDDNFEQELINLGYDNVLDDSVITANISGISQLFVNNLNIVDLTGIEDFISLETLNCNFNPELLNLDLSNNTELLSVSANQILGNKPGNLAYINVNNCTKLQNLTCLHSQVDNIEVTNCIDLVVLNIGHNLINSIDVSNNLLLETIIIDNNLISEIDVSNNGNLNLLDISDNPNLQCVDVRNQNNINISGFYSTGNSSLYCISVDDSLYSSNNWTNILPQHYFSNNCPVKCSSSNIYEYNYNKNILHKIDVLGRNVKEIKNTPVFFIYDNGTVEKKVILE